jgi:hypothetical protein
MKSLTRWLPMLMASLILASGLVTLVGQSPVSATPGTSATFTSTTVGQIGNTPSFSESGDWTMSFSFSSCSSGGWGSTIYVPGTIYSFPGPTDGGTSGSGTDEFYATGTFYINVNSACAWTISIAPATAPALVAPTTFTSEQVGLVGSTQLFSVSAPWTVTYSFSGCTEQNFAAGAFEPPYVVGPGAPGVSPGEITGIGGQTSGSGSQTFKTPGTFYFIVSGLCSWTMSISSSSPSSPSSTTPPTAVGIASTPDGGGYWIAFSNGAVSPHGDANNFGGVSNLHLNAPINHIVATSDGDGYWLVASDGGTFSLGDANFYGSTGSTHLNAPVVDMAPTPDDGGYWLVASDGGIFSFGDAQFHGSTGSIHLNRPVVGMASTPDGGGYWLVATDGGIFAFGDSHFYGSTGSIHLNKSVNGMASTKDGLGYWFVASDGGIFNYGDAAFAGSAGSLPLVAPIVGMAPDYATGGYWLLGSDGGIFSYGAPFDGAH